jgi:transposase
LRAPRFFCGIDWADQFNDVAVIDNRGAVVARARITATPEGVRELFATLDGLLAGHSHGRRQVPVAIETNRSLLVHTLLGRRQPVFQVPPNEAAARRRQVSHGRKSDRTDAELLAQILRDRWGQLKALPQTSPEATAITVLAHAQQRAQRLREQLQARLRVLLVHAHPAAVHAWEGRDHGLCRPEARAVLQAGPTAASAQKITAYRWEKILTGVRLRLIEQEALRLRDLFAVPVLRLPPPVEDATAAEIRALLTQFDHACDSTEQLTAELIVRFENHRHAGIYLSFPGCGPLTGPRLLAEIGDDLTRFATGRGLRAYAGVAPRTWASGTSTQITHRWICNRTLKVTCHRWAFSSLTRSPGARALYDHRRDHGDTYSGALRRVAGRLLSGLHHCLTTGGLYDEQRLFPTRQVEPG